VGPDEWLVSESTPEPYPGEGDGGDSEDGDEGSSLGGREQRRGRGRVEGVKEGKEEKEGDEEEEREGTRVVVTASFTDVPLEVIPGREKEFRGFVAKVLFSTSGAMAGVQGTAAVSVHVEGLPIAHDSIHSPPGDDDEPENEGEGGDDEEDTGTIELYGLPFSGRVRVGKKGLVKGELDVEPDI